ncbi:hypothetical protein GJAV_G00196220 [Gymnothorax javanicus]|nr:hypothetical protein GJAV_G00196220 [Gymnothorax javanicus]
MAAWLRPQENFGYIWNESWLPCPHLCLGGNAEPVEGWSYIMDHGTSREAAGQIMAGGFRQSSDGMLGPGVYVSRDLKKASKYPLHLPEHERVVLKLIVDVGRVKKIDFQGHPMQKTWHTVYGYDTAWVPPNCGMVESNLEEDCVWDPCRIRVIEAISPALWVGGWAMSQAWSYYRW